MSTKKNLLGALLVTALMVLTGVLLLRDQPFSTLGKLLSQIHPAYVLLGLGLMLVYVGCEATQSRIILGRLGHKLRLRQCLAWSFVGFYVSSVTPSATGGQPAQIYCMSRDGIPPAHGALNMMLIAACYQVATLVYGLVAWLLIPAGRTAMDGGLGLLLLYGCIVMVALTAGMLTLMFLPGAARSLTGGVLRLLERLHLLKDPTRAREKLELQLAEYAAGAKCIRQYPLLTVRLLGLTLVQLTALFSVPYAVYLAFGLTGHSLPEVVGVQALLTLAVCNIPLPGAVGPAEGGFVRAFTLFFGAGMVTPAMLVSRGISFYAFLIISAVITLAVTANLRKRTRQQSLDDLRRQTSGRVQAVDRYLKRRTQPSQGA